MKLLHFLTYEKPYIYLYMTIFFIIAIVFYTDSRDWEWGTLLYAFILTSVVLLIFLLFRYQQYARIIRQMKKGDYESLTMEGKFAKEQMEELNKTHIREMNAIQNKQNEHYDFIVSWFHEIKTPIAVLHLLQQTDMDANSLGEEITKIENYVDQALYYAKLDSFNQDYDIQHCDLIQIAKKVIKSHAKTFISKKIRIDIRAETLVVQSDPKWLQFIINQFISNSLKYTERGGQITLSTSETPKEKQFIIKDTGIGITEKDLPRIYYRGFTGETGRTHGKSTGMGLYLAQQLSRKLGHYISCTSKAGEFTQFIIHFPLDADPYLWLQKGTHETADKN